jgi:quercetin dioxygenase-like cupin family protein
MALLIVPNEGLSCGDEESSRNCPARTCESCSSCYGFFDTRGGAGMKTIYKRDLPPVSLDGWQVTVLRLIFPTGFTSPKHVHPGFVLGYILEGELRFHIEGEPQTLLSAGDAFYEAPGAIHLPSRSASATKPARVLVVAFGEKEKELTKPPMINERVLQTAKVFLRLSLSAAFLSAIGDRFGLWGRYGGKNVSWGDWAHFLQFVAYLNPFMPKALIPTIGVVETVLEFTLALALLGGFYQRIVAWASAALLTSFALTMSIALGMLAPMGYGVFTAAAAALLLGAVTRPHVVPAPATAGSAADSARA